MTNEGVIDMAQFSLMGKGGPMDGQFFPMADNAINIGTDPSCCAIIYPGGSANVDALHCQLVPQDDGSWLITDCSNFGTWLNGRLNRKRYLLRATLNMCLYFAALFVIFVILGVLGIDPSESTISKISLVVGIPFSISSLTLGVRRLHDIDKSGWWLLGGCVPLLNIWVAGCMIFKKGTDGLNRFGADPLNVR